MNNNLEAEKVKDHLPVLNSMRGIAAIMIMVHHIAVYLLPQLSANSHQITPFFKKNYLWVDFFFMLSGFVACHVYKKRFFEKISLKTYSSFIISRFARLYPLHVIILILFVIVEFVYLYAFHAEGLATRYSNVPLPFDSEFSEKALLLGVMMLNSLPPWGTWNGPSWAMSAIWITAFMVPYAIKIISNFKIVANFAIILGCFAILWILVVQFESLDIMSAEGLVRCFVETLMGIACYNIYSTVPPNRIVTSQYTVVFVLMIAFVSMLLHINHIISVFILLALIFVSAYQGMKSIFSNRYLLLLGNMSFSIYLIHWLPFKILDKISLVATGSKFKSVDSLYIVILTLSFTVLLIMYSSYLAFAKIETPLRIQVKEKLLNIS